jgi:hypothetical protein
MKAGAQAFANGSRRLRAHQLMQCPKLHVSVLGHTVPQLPQLFLSELRSTHEKDPPQNVKLGLTHEYWQVPPPPQLALTPGPVLQGRQLGGGPQASMPRGLHCELPQNWSVPAQSQTPLWHCRPPVHTMPQPLQLLLSLCRFAQVVEPHAE